MRAGWISPEYIHFYFSPSSCRLRPAQSLSGGWSRFPIARAGWVMRSIVGRRSRSARSFSFNGSRRNTDTPERHGAAQPNRFDPARAARLDDPARFGYLPPLEIVRLLDLKPGARLIDYGTGTGTYAVEIARARPDVALFALDEQAEMLDQARAKFTVAGLTNVDAIETARLAALRGSVDRVFALN